MSPQNVIEIQSPAKINLTLEILYRRNDGFHELKTVMQELKFGDILRLSDLPSGQLKLFCDDPALPTGHANLAYQAALLLRDRYAPGRGVSINLNKRIPVAAGLGGGSSNAAAVLKGLNKLWDLNLSINKLQELAAQLGSDVPFFLFGGTALAVGRGENITSLPPIPKVPVLLISVPAQSLSTALVYGSLKWDKVKTGKKTDSLVQFLKGVHDNDEEVKDEKELLAQLFSFMVNDLETGAFALADNLPSLKEELKQRGLMPMLSGSGPTLFALCPDYNKLAAAAEELLENGYGAILTHFAQTPMPF